jgi:hypothetical protein
VHDDALSTSTWIGRLARRRGDDKQFPHISIQKLRDILRRKQQFGRLGRPSAVSRSDGWWPTMSSRPPERTAAARRVYTTSALGFGQRNVPRLELVRRWVGQDWGRRCSSRRRTRLPTGQVQAGHHRVQRQQHSGLKGTYACALRVEGEGRHSVRPVFVARPIAQVRQRVCRSVCQLRVERPRPRAHTRPITAKQGVFWMNGFISRRTVRTIALVLPVLVIGNAVAAAGPAFAGQPGTSLTCIDAPMGQMGTAGVAGSARVCTSPLGVRADIYTSNLAAGDAYTAWFIYFDQAAACNPRPCTPADAIGDNPLGVFGRIDSLIADASGNGAFTGDVRGLKLSSGSEVHLPVFGHGRASADDNRLLARQLLTPELPMLGAPGLGVPAATNRGGPVAEAVLVIP